MSSANIKLTSGGMVCAVGHGASAACAAIRAGLSGFTELGYRDEEGNELYGAPVPGISPPRHSMERLGAMLAMSVTDCLSRAPRVDREPLPLLLGIAEPDRPGGLDLPRAATLIDEVGRDAGSLFHPRLSKVFATGHTSAFRALAAAREMISIGAVTACLVAGVDSYVNAQALNWLDERYRLKTRGNSDGVIPGEAAACVLVERARSGAVTASLRGLGFGHEPAGILTSEPPLMAEGLVQASRAALSEAGLGLEDIDLRMSDVAGEGYSFKELALSLQRVLRVRRETFPLWHAAEAIGDTGAAAGACHMVLALEAFRKGYAPGPRVIAYGSSVRGDRATAILEACRG